MRMISGLSNKSSGNIELFGKNVKKILVILVK
nr:hypothetical protein [Anaerococcus obesiensis]